MLKIIGIVQVSSIGRSWRLLQRFDSILVYDYVTNYQKLNSIKQHTCIVSQFLWNRNLVITLLGSLLRSHKNEIKVFAMLHSFLISRTSSKSKWFYQQNLIPRGCMIEVPFYCQISFGDHSQFQGCPSGPRHLASAQELSLGSSHFQGQQKNIDDFHGGPSYFFYRALLIRSNLSRLISLLIKSKISDQQL